MFVYIMFFLGHIRSIKTLLVRRSSTASVCTVQKCILMSMESILRLPRLSPQKRLLAGLLL
jgi:hypothetical protein